MLSSQYLGKEGEGGQGNVAHHMSPSILHDCKSRGLLGMKERMYLGLSVSSSTSNDGPVMKISIEESKGGLNLNLKATELRLGLPGSESPERGGKKADTLSSEPIDKKQLFSLLLSKDGIYSSRNTVSGNKRGFSDTIKEFSSTPGGGGERNWMFKNGVSDSETSQSAGQGKTTSVKSGATLPNVKTECLSKEEELLEAKESSHNKMNASDSPSPPVAKAQVVGWPPVRSFRKNSLATASKNTEEADGKRSPGAYFVKVSMDGAPYLRKVDLKSYSTYQELSLALEKMFSCFTFGKSDASESPKSETKLRASLRGSDYVLTFEDKDGDWMLVGDVPWEMFIDSCKRLKIMKGSDAIGLASKGVEVDSKTKN